jgi:hypothetical protein
MSRQRSRDKKKRERIVNPAIRLEIPERHSRRAAVRAALGLTIVSINLAQPIPDGSDIKGSDAPDKLRLKTLGAGTVGGFRYPNARLGSVANASVIQRFGSRKIVTKTPASCKRFYGMRDPQVTALVGHRLTKRKHRIVISKHTWKGQQAGSTPVNGYTPTLKGV